jgi:hypothetical protein
MEVFIIEEAGYREALYGLGFSFGLTPSPKRLNVPP